MEKRRLYGDAVITGFGKVEGRLVYVYAQDFSVLGGTVGHCHADKICNLMRLARGAKAPIVGLLDTAGARIQEGVSTYGSIFAENVLASGVVPQISAIMGNCAGGGVYSPALTDFIFMVEGSYMFITGPEVIKQVTGEEITMEDLGGAKAQSQISGVCDFTAKDDKDCLQQIRKLLGFLDYRYCDTTDDPNRCDDELDTIVPTNPRQPFDMHRIIYKIVDNGDFMEAKANFARNIITGFGRLAGYCVGFVANQPLFAAGSLDSDACDKAARFYRLCDCFDIPLVCLVDVPGYLPGVVEECKGIIRHGAKMLYGLREATVPKISVVIRKAYGGAYVAMGSKSIGMDMALAWPTAEIAIMGAEGAVAILYRREIEQAEDKEQFRKERVREYKERFSTPYYTASKQIIDAIIRPRETRLQLIRVLEALRNKHESPVPRKHGNIPL
jgi:acetyl-CoA carboxylase carboxyltransferase component